MSNYDSVSSKSHTIFYYLKIILSSFYRAICSSLCDQLDLAEGTNEMRGQQSRLLEQSQLQITQLQDEIIELDKAKPLSFTTPQSTSKDKDLNNQTNISLDSVMFSQRVYEVNAPTSRADELVAPQLPASEPPALQINTATQQQDETEDEILFESFAQTQLQLGEMLMTLNEDRDWSYMKPDNILDAQLQLAEDKILQLEAERTAMEQEIKTLKLDFDGQNRAKWRLIHELETKNVELNTFVHHFSRAELSREQGRIGTKSDVMTQTDVILYPRQLAPAPGQVERQTSSQDDQLSQLLFNNPAQGRGREELSAQELIASYKMSLASNQQQQQQQTMQTPRSFRKKHRSSQEHMDSSSDEDDDRKYYTPYTTHRPSKQNAPNTNDTNNAVVMNRSMESHMSYDTYATPSAATGYAYDGYEAQPSQQQVQVQKTMSMRKKNSYSEEQKVTGHNQSTSKIMKDRQVSFAHFQANVEDEGEVEEDAVAMMERALKADEDELMSMLSSSPAAVIRPTTAAKNNDGIKKKQSSKRVLSFANPPTTTTGLNAVLQQNLENIPMKPRQRGHDDTDSSSDFEEETVRNITSYESFLTNEMRLFNEKSSHNLTTKQRSKASLTRQDGNNSGSMVEMKDEFYLSQDNTDVNDDQNSALTMEELLGESLLQQSTGSQPMRAEDLMTSANSNKQRRGNMRAQFTIEQQQAFERELSAADIDILDEDTDLTMENMRLEWENRQVTKQKDELDKENKQLRRELELYRTKIFTIVNNEGSMINGLPDINISYKNTNNMDFDYLTPSTSSSQALYIINQLVQNNNELVDRKQWLEQERTRLSSTLTEKDELLHKVTNELQEKEIQTERMKAIISQANSTITATNEDYQVLQKQVQILTKKLQSVMSENQQLTEIARRYYPSS